MATLTVTTNADSGTGSLRQAIADAASGDTIVFDSTVFPAGQTTAIPLASTLTISKSLTIDAGDPVKSGEGAQLQLTCRVALDGQNTVKIVETLYEAMASWNGVCFQRGKATSGGGLYADTDSQNTFTECVFSGNTATNGGGLYAYSGSQNTFTECVFSGNTASNGGGLYAEAGSQNTFTECVFSGNTASGLYCRSLSYGDSTIILNNGNIILDVLYAKSYNTTRTPLITCSGYNGFRGFEINGTAPNFSGSGHVALPSSVSVTLPATITRSEYGAGVSNFATSGNDLTWSSTDSTKSVLLEKQNGANWDTVSTSATSPDTVSSEGVYRIWDGATFLTESVIIPPQTLVVTNTNDSGSGSLRAAINSATVDDTIIFDPSLAGETITLNAGLEPRNEVTIVGLTDSDGNPAITVDGNGNYTFNSSYPVHVSNVAFNGGWGAFSSNGGFDGSTFENCTFENMDLNVFEISVKTTEYLAITESGATVSLIVSISDLSEWSVGDEFHFEDDIAYFEVSRVTTDTHGQGLIQASRRTVSDQEYLAPEEGIIIAGRPGAGIEFTDCVFSDNAASDLLLSGVVNVTLSGGNVLTEGFDLTDAGTVVINNAGYNGVGGYTAPTTGTASVAGSEHIALPDAAVVTVAQTVTRSEFGAGLTAISANNLTISWNATDSTKSVLLEVENGASWDAVDDDATSPATVSAAGTYRVWDGVAFFSTSVEPEPAIAVRPGRRVCRSLQFDYTNEGAETIDAGTAMKIGSAFGVIETAILPGATGTVTTLGTWFIPCLDTTVADFGDVAYWDDENKKVTSNDSGTMRIGLFVKPVSSGETEATVMIFPASAASSGD